MLEPEGDPGGCFFGEDLDEVGEEGGEDAAAVEVDEEFFFDLGRVVEFFVFAGLEALLDHFDELFVGEGKAANE